MTVLDANNSLFEWFREHHSFEIDRDLKKIIPILDDEVETIISYRLALEELEANNLIAHQDYNEKKFYVLTKPFESYNQNPDVPSWTATAVAAEINEFCELIEDFTDQCNMSALNAKDLQNLVHITQYYKTKVMEKENLIGALSGLSGEDGILPPPPLEDGENGDDNKKNKKKK